MTKKRNEYNYGECEVCNGRMKEQSINQDFWVRGRLIIVKNVPAGVCPNCGEKVVRGDVGLRIGELIEDSKLISKARRISVPTIEFSPKRVAA